MGERKKRPALSRTGPVRNRAFGYPLDLAGGAASMVDAANEAALGFVERGVQTAYRVCDEYMQRGREAANSHCDRGETMSERCGGYGYGGPSQWGPAGLFGPWIDVMRMWNDAMWQFATGAAGAAACRPRWRRDRADEYCGGRLSVEVSAPQIVTVTADLDHDCYDERLSVDDLEIERGKELIKADKIDISCREGRVVVRMKLEEQTEGMYSGAIRDRDGCRRGKLSIKIANP